MYFRQLKDMGSQKTLHNRKNNSQKMNGIKNEKHGRNPKDSAFSEEHYTFTSYNTIILLPSMVLLPIYLLIQESV